MKKISIFLQAILFLAVTGFMSCTHTTDDELKDTDDDFKSQKFTIAEGDNNWKFLVNETEYSGITGWVNSLNSDKFFTLNFDGKFPIGGIQWLPKKAGTYKGGDDLGEGKGSVTGKIYFNMSVAVDGELYYAYSSNPYGDVESARLAGTDCTVKLVKFEGGFVRYNSSFGTYSTFKGQIDGFFTGTFKTKDGSKTIKVKNGEFRYSNDIPPGTTLVE